MTFDEVLSQVQELLQREQRVSYRGLKRRFALDDEYLEDLKEELIGAKRLAADEEGRFLVWRGAQEPAAALSRPPAHQASVPPAEPRPPEAERRQLTVEFIDLVGSTQLSAQLDPEEYREIVRAYQQASAAVIDRFEGYMAQYLGDGLLVYFGYPVAHEDDAARAVRAGLRIIEAVHALKTRLTRPLQVRIGIHTGLVVVGEMGGGRRQEQLALGETPNLAARIQGQAEPDTVFISAATYRLIEGLFDCEDCGQPMLKGVSVSLTLYRVVKEEEAQSRFQVVARKGLTPLIGREHEYGLLRERWARVKDGEGQVVLLSGEPGIGKSRLVEALKEIVEHEGARCLELRCSPYHQKSALYPIIEHLQRGLRFRSGDSSEEKLRKLVGTTHVPPLQTEAIPLLATLLSLPHPEGYPLITLSPQKQKEKTHEALIEWLGKEAKQQAMIYAWEDLHWADPSTLELLTLYLAQIPTTQLLAVLTFRPEFTAPWGAHSYLSQIMLSRLGRSHVEVMVEKVTGDKALPREIVQQIVIKTDGVPLFVEELTKMVVEDMREQRTEDGAQEGQIVGTRQAAPLSLGIPATLQDALMARLDRLGPAKEIAQVGATIGREFNYDVLQAVSPLNEEVLQHGLQQLVESELVYQSGVPPLARYLFKHALVQDTAYQSLLKSKRQHLHQLIAQMLVERFPETVETQPELLAHHYTEAELIEQAVPYWQQAGQRAIERSANVEAISYLTRGLELLNTLPETPARAQQELNLQIALGPTLSAAKGVAAPEVEQTYARARALCAQVGEAPQLFPALLGLYGFYLNRGALPTARELGEQLLQLAERTADPTHRLYARETLGLTLFFLGDYSKGRTHMEQGVALINPTVERTLALRYGGAPGVRCLGVTANTLWCLGYPAQAMQRSEEALALARELAHPYSLVMAQFYAAWLHYRRREVPAVQARADVLLTLASAQGFPLLVGLGTCWRGWALAMQGGGETGLAQLRQGLAAVLATGEKLQRPLCLVLLAEAAGYDGQVEEGLHLLAEALAVLEANGLGDVLVEVYRLRGELTLAQSRLQTLDSRVKEAEECFWKAIDIARKQQAKSLELRAVMSVAKLWQHQGKEAEARQMLAEIYGWFTEGFDTVDLQEAQALLKELN